jgi:hypothetical protein
MMSKSLQRRVVRVIVVCNADMRMVRSVLPENNNICNVLACQNG